MSTSNHFLEVFVFFLRRLYLLTPTFIIEPFLYEVVPPRKREP